ncbi:MAG TPA: DUF4148 domain-containing protein [Ramlibacter sp.]|jgi:hypothetical protein|uniref:DUF4148 domain-containing protein n=1 Tax=Ramlibacter sp. TaxID=1917967 RepID=UPI002D4474A6|nr:DUF4148 domain-containing protein [Ramlibacter sp.]HZY20669.1 DUF4148 domain-containing protein [Ramlibacter sp.]
MNNRRLIAVTLSLAAASLGGQAFAQSAGLYGQEGGATTAFVPSKTRAEVRAELDQYRAARVNPWSTTYNPLRNFKSATTRADVTAAYLASRDEVRAFTGEDSGSAFLAQAGGRTLAGTTLAGQADQGNLR